MSRLAAPVVRIAADELLTREQKKKSSLASGSGEPCVFGKRADECGRTVTLMRIGGEELLETGGGFLGSRSTCVLHGRVKPCYCCYGGHPWWADGSEGTKSE